MATHATHTQHAKAPAHRRPPPRRAARRQTAPKERDAEERNRIQPARLESTIEQTGERIQARLGRVPYIAAAGAGLGLLLLANAVGAGEIGLAAVGGYVVLRMLKDRATPEKAMKDGIKGE